MGKRSFLPARAEEHWTWSMRRNQGMWSETFRVPFAV